MVIFVIDDDQSMLRGFLLLLQAAGFDAKAFRSAEEFLTHPDISDSDCIILDIRMPVMNGFDLMQKLALKGIHTPVICVTAFDDAKSRERARALGAAGYLTKPVDDHALIDAINWACSSERNEKDLRRGA